MKFTEQYFPGPFRVGWKPYRAGWKPYLFPCAILGFFTLLALFPELFAPYGPRELVKPWCEPCAEYLLGTSNLGRDNLTLLIYAARITLLIGFASAALAISIGVVIGLISGWHRGPVDDLLMGATDIVMIIPKFPLIIILSAYLSPGPWILILVLGALSWEGVARVVRSKVLQVRSTEYILCARCLGFSRWHIMFREIFPVVLPVVVPQFVLATAGAMLSESALSFLGLSSTTMTSWGVIISDAYTYGGFSEGMWYWWLPPAVCIILCVIAVTSIAFIHERGQRVVIQS